jgi:hypothetical protein
MLILVPLALFAAGPQTPAPAPTTAPAAPAAGAQAGPPPEFMAAAQGLNQCVGQGASALPASVKPDTGAQQVLAGCATQRATLDKQFETWINGPTFPAAQRDFARAQYQQRLAALPQQLSAALAQRAAAAAAPAAAATPTPGATPTGTARPTGR